MTPTGHHGPSHYAIQVSGRLPPGWSAWFDGLDVTSAEDGTTTLHGAVLDQAALHGVLTKVRDLGLPILSVARIAPRPDDGGSSPVTVAAPADERGA